MVKNFSNENLTSFITEHSKQLRQDGGGLQHDRGGAGLHDQHGAAHQRDEAQARARGAHQGGAEHLVRLGGRGPHHVRGSRP